MNSKPHTYRAEGILDYQVEGKNYRLTDLHFGKPLIVSQATAAKIFSSSQPPKVIISYDPTNPQKAGIVKDNLTKNLILFGIGLFASIACLIGMVLI